MRFELRKEMPKIDGGLKWLLSRPPLFWTKVVREGIGNYLSIILIELYFGLFFLSIYKITINDSDLYQFFILFLLLALMQHLVTGMIRSSTSYLCYLIKSAEWQSSRIQQTNRYVKGHLNGVARLGNSLNDGKFEDLILIELARHGKSDSRLTLKKILYAINLDLLDKVAKDGAKALSDYHQMVKSSLNECKSTREAWIHITASRYASIPEETVSVALDHPASTYIHRMESHIELTRLVVTLLFTILFVIVASVIYAVWGIHLSLP